MWQAHAAVDEEERPAGLLERRSAADLERRATEAEAKLKRLYEAIENGVIDVNAPSLKGPDY